MNQTFKNMIDSGDYAAALEYSQGESDNAFDDDNEPLGIKWEALASQLQNSLDYGLL